MFNQRIEIFMKAFYLALFCFLIVNNVFGQSNNMAHLINLNFVDERIVANQIKNCSVYEYKLHKNGTQDSSLLSNTQYIYNTDHQLIREELATKKNKVNPSSGGWDAACDNVDSFPTHVLSTRRIS